MKAKVPWLLGEVQRKMLADFAIVIGVASALGISQNRQILDVPLFHIITKEIFRKNVALTSFVGMIAIVVARR
jgi:hypothetical protein